METDKLKIYRNMLKSSDIDELESIRPDCQKGIPEPYAFKPYNLEDKLIKLCEIEDTDFEFLNFFEIIKNRKSRRVFSGEKITFKELSFLLRVSCGVREIKNDRIFRTSPSACCRHPFETYVVINKVEELKSGLYRYFPPENALILLKEGDFGEKSVELFKNQKFVNNSAINIIWTVVPYRSEWRSGKASYKLSAIDIGHYCQNAYLGAEALNLGCCAIASYNQKMCDDFLGVDGEEEYTVYIISAGRKGN